MIFYGLDSIIDEVFAKEEECFPLRFEGEALLVAHANKLDKGQRILDYCRAKGVDDVRLLDYSSREIQRLIHSFYSIELKDKEIYRHIRAYIQSDAFEGLFLYLVASAKEFGASDIHIAVENDYCFIKFRIHGKIKTFSIIEERHLPYLCRVIKVKGNTDLARTLKAVDTRITVTIQGEDLDIRVAIINTIAGEKITLRLLNNENVPKSIKELGLTEEEERIIQQNLEKTSGTILVTGPQEVGNPPR